MIILSSFYNEEYLLPWWLEHHKKIFEHGVLVNYFSTDKSIEIIKKICPTWEIRNTKNKDWDFAKNDEEWMEIEKEFDDYKIILTTTEFLMGVPELKKELTAYAIPMIRMVDISPENIPTYNKPLVEQKNVGIANYRKNKHRFLHNYATGKYSIGRHKTEHKITSCSEVIYKYVFSPWTEEFIERKLQMGNYMSKNDKENGRGRHHTLNRKQLEKRYEKSLKNNSLLHFK